MIHLAGVGAEYVREVNADGREVVKTKRLVGTPTETLCGKALASLSRESGVEVVLPHDHPSACKRCLRSLPGRAFAHVQPLMFPGAV